MPKVNTQVKGAHTRSMSTRQKPWPYQLAFWGVGLLLFFPPYFRGLFFATEQQRVLILAAALFWLVWLGKHNRREYTFLSHPLDYFILALPLVYIIAGFNAVNYGLALDEMVKNILYFLVYWLVIQLAQEEGDLSSFLHIIYIAATGVALAGLATATGIVNIKDGFLNSRIYSSFQYPNALASYLALACFLGLYFWQKNGQLTLATTITDLTLKKLLPDWLLKLRPYGYLYIMANFILLAVLFGTKSRGGLLITGVIFILYLIGLNWQKRLPVLVHTLFAGGLGYFLIHRFITNATEKQMGMAWLWIIAGLGVVLLAQAAYNFLLSHHPLSWLNEQKKAGKILIGLIGLTVATGGVILAFRPELLQKILSFTYLRNALERTYFIKDALAMLKERPVLGWGGGGWEEAYRAFQGYLYNSNEVHSYYFQVAVETGILGLLAVLGIWVAFFWATYRAYKASTTVDRKTLVWTLFAIALAVGGHAMIDFDLSLSALTIALWIVFAGARVLEGLALHQQTVDVNKLQEKTTEGKKSKRRVPEKKKGQDKQGANSITPGKRNTKKGVSGSNISTMSKRHASLPPAQPVLLAVFSVISLLLLVLGMTLTSASTYVRSASESLQEQNIQQGLSYMKKAVAYNPLNAEYHANLVRIYMATGKPELALAEARQAAALSQYSAVRQADLASAYLSAGKSDDAVNSARRAVELAPYQIAWYETLANVCTLAGQSELVAGKKEEARKHLKEVLQIPVLIANRVAGLGEEEKRLWKDAPMLAPTPKIQLYTGQAHYLLGQLPEAEKELQHAAKEEQIKGEALVWLALVKEKQGKRQEAQELVGQAQAVNKAYGNIFEQLQGLPSF